MRQTPLLEIYSLTFFQIDHAFVGLLELLLQHTIRKREILDWNRLRGAKIKTKNKNNERPAPSQQRNKQVNNLPTHPNKERQCLLHANQACEQVHNFSTHFRR